MATRVFGMRKLALVLVLVLAQTGHAFADDIGVTAEQSSSPIRGSTLTYRNVGSTISLYKDSELTYNPYYAMELGFSPRWWFTKHLYVRADVEFSRELTNADDSTQSGEVWWSDALGRIGASRILTIPVAGISFSPAVTVIAPTSKISQARTRILGVRPELTVSRTFDLLSGITLSYAVQGTRYFNKYTTSERDLPLIPGCSSSLGGCDEYLNTGARNAKWRLTNLAALSVDFFDWLGVSASAGVVVDYLYPREQDDERVSFVPQEPAEERYVMLYDVELYGRPMPSLGLAVGASTLNPQLAPDSSKEEVFFNRYTTVYFDLTFHIDGFVSQLTSEGGK